jgi:hypothetical protein
MDRDRRFTQFSTPASLTVSWKVLEERVSTFLRDRSASTPLFLHLNFQDGHFPYRNPDILPLVDRQSLERSQLRVEAAPALRAMYLNTLANVDASLGRVLDLVARTTGREPAVVVIADHGESLFDEGFLGHGYAANDAQTRIPFIVHNLPARVPDPVGQLDVRLMMRQALSEDAAAGPVLAQDPARTIFQYIGDLATPKEIARVGLEGRRRYNLMSPSVQSHGLGADDTALVQFWERVNHSLASTRR